RATLHDGALNDEFVRQPLVVRIDEGDERLRRGADALIAREARSAVAGLQEADAVGISLHHDCGLVGRAVVDNDDLVVVHYGSEDGIDRSREQMGAVVGWDDDTDGERWAHDSFRVKDSVGAASLTTSRLPARQGLPRQPSRFAADNSPR